MTPFRDIVESDLSDREKIERIGDVLDLIKLGNRETAFLIDMIVYLFEKLDKHRADPTAHTCN